MAWLLKALGGGPALPFTLDEEVTSYSGTQWKMFKGTHKATSRPVSIFKLELRTQACALHTRSRPQAGC